MTRCTYIVENEENFALLRGGGRQCALEVSEVVCKGRRKGGAQGGVRGCTSTVQTCGTRQKTRGNSCKYHFVYSRSLREGKYIEM